MTPTKQLIPTLDIDEGVLGDCWRTCIAMILDLKPEEVPHFIALGHRMPDVEHPDGIGLEPAWMALTRDWLLQRGYRIDSYAGPKRGYTGWAIATGPSPRGDFYHAIVVYVVSMKDDRYSDWRAGADPHPDNTFLAGEPVEFAIIQEA